MGNRHKPSEDLSICLYLFKYSEYNSCYTITYDSVIEVSVNSIYNACDMYLKLQSHVLNTLMLLLSTSRNYRSLVLKNCYKLLHNYKMTVTVNEVPDNLDIIDREWSSRTNRLACERLQMDTVMSYLSTLGGAFSALGDSYTHCAKTAGLISWRQFQIALRLSEEPLAARCRLYMALSLMQQGMLKPARKLITSQFKIAKKFNDTRLENMCRGVWAKLQYTRQMQRKRKVEE